VSAGQRVCRDALWKAVELCANLIWRTGPIKLSGDFSSLPDSVTVYAGVVRNSIFLRRNKPLKKIDVERNRNFNESVAFSAQLYS
jgi:hypothetical protein